jgi:hypothetical protein
MAAVTGGVGAGVVVLVEEVEHPVRTGAKATTKVKAKRMTVHSWTGAMNGLRVIEGDTAALLYRLVRERRSSEIALKSIGLAPGFTFARHATCHSMN